MQHLGARRETGAVAEVFAFSKEGNTSCDVLQPTQVDANRSLAVDDEVACSFVVEREEAAAFTDLP
jgi:hypothetical protein